MCTDTLSPAPPLPDLRLELPRDLELDLEGALVAEWRSGGT